MKKVSFWMDEPMVNALLARKKATGAPFAELVRRAVHAYLQMPSIDRPAQAPKRAPKKEPINVPDTPLNPPLKIDLSLQKNAQPSLAQLRAEFRQRLHIPDSVPDADIDDSLGAQ